MHLQSCEPQLIYQETSKETFPLFPNSDLIETTEKCFRILHKEAVAQVFWKKGVLRNFAKFTGKQLRQSLFFNKVAGFRPATLLKKKLWHSCFPVNFAKSLRTPFLT